MPRSRNASAAARSSSRNTGRPSGLALRIIPFRSPASRPTPGLPTW
jgi:hypothetical protein